MKIITEGKSAEESETILSLLSNALPNGGKDGYVVAVCSQVGNPSNKVIVMPSHDSPEAKNISLGWEKKEQQQQATNATAAMNRGRRGTKRKVPPTVEIDD